jgi:hypothetical protein
MGKEWGSSCQRDTILTAVEMCTGRPFNPTGALGLRLERHPEIASTSRPSQFVHLVPLRPFCHCHPSTGKLGKRSRRGFIWHWACPSRSTGQALKARFRCTRQRGQPERRLLGWTLGARNRWAVGNRGARTGSQRSMWGDAAATAAEYPVGSGVRVACPCAKPARSAYDSRADH